MDCYQLFADKVKRFKVGSDGQFTGLCPFHDDHNPSFSVCLDKDSEKYGQWNCRGCGAKGNTYQFAEQLGIDSTPYKSFKRSGKPYSQSNIETKAKRLNDYLITNFDELQAAGKIPMSWTLQAAVDTYSGYDKTKDCLVFNHCNLSGQPINIQHHKGKQDGQSKSKLFPLNLIPKYDKASFLVFCEGCKDAVTLLSHGINTITNTTGAASIPKDLTPLKDFQQIYIVYDNDPPGYDGAENLARTLKNTFPDQKVYTYEWHLKTKPGFDVTDYFSNGGTVKGFSHMMDYATPYQCTTITNETKLYLYRKITDSRVYKDPDLLQFWIFCLTEASHKRTVVNAKCGSGNKQISLDRGQFLFSLEKAKRKTQQAGSTLRDRLKKLENMGNIRTDKVNGRTLVTICKWRLYQ